jgi:hypothetical protein
VIISGFGGLKFGGGNFLQFSHHVGAQIWEPNRLNGHSRPLLWGYHAETTPQIIGIEGEEHIRLHIRNWPIRLKKVVRLNQCRPFWWERAVAHPFLTKCGEHCLELSHVFVISPRRPQTWRWKDFKNNYTTWKLVSIPFKWVPMSWGFNRVVKLPIYSDKVDLCHLRVNHIQTDLSTDQFNEFPIRSKTNIHYQIKIL